ncbi:hypothetical protein LABOLPEG_00039 [Pseudomonas phage phi 21A]|nr:hypothetical protein LABOLPEG_00039 [Pseudomonas phage phi 21A]
MKAKYIRFIGPHKNTLGHTCVHEWYTGKGPCGRWVHTLDIKIDKDFVRIKQESYSKDQTELLQIVADLQAQVGVFHQVATMDRLLDADNLLRKDRKVEHFVYKMDDIKGRIKWEGA